MKITRKWHTGFQARLVPGSHQCDKELTERVDSILREEFGLKGIRTIPTFSDTPNEEKYDGFPNRSVVIGTFQNKEARFEIGTNTLQEFQKDAIYFITHLYNVREGVDPATTIAQMRLFAREIRAKTRAKQLTFVTPIGAYDLNHSKDGKELVGLIEGGSLEMYLSDLKRDGCDEIITICPHSPTTAGKCRDLMMGFREVNPFRDELGVSAPGMGPFLYQDPTQTKKRPDYKKQMERLTPLMSWLRKTYGRRSNQLYFIGPDKGSRRAVEQITASYRGDMQHIIGIIKDRPSPGVVVIRDTASWSTAELSELSGKVCIAADDLLLTGGTLNSVCDILKKDYKVKEVVAVVAHDGSYDPRVLERKGVDRYVILETNPNSAIAGIKDPRVVRMPLDTTALLIAAEIFDSYVNLRDYGGTRIR